MSELEKSGSAEFVENSNSWGKSSNSELATKAQELNKSRSNVWNSSNTPINYIENLDEWKKFRKHFAEMAKKKEKEIGEILELSEEKRDDLDIYRQEKTKLDVELQKIIWSLLYQLYNHIDFFSEIKDKIDTLINSWVQRNPIFVKMEDLGNDKLLVKLISDGELPQEKKDKLCEDVKMQLSEQWYNLSNMEFERCNKEQEDFKLNWNDATITQTIEWENINIWNDDLSWTINEDDKQNDETENDWWEINLLHLYLLLTEKNTKDYFLSFLDDSEKEELRKLELDPNLKNLLDKYKEIQRQLSRVSSKIDILTNEVSEIDDECSKYENDIVWLQENYNEQENSFFLNSHLSWEKVYLDDFVASPMVDKQIRYILELKKKWLPIPKTILLYWWHNLWKTHTAKLLGTELDRKLYHILSYDISNPEFEDAGLVLSSIFSTAINKKEPCIIFLDEMEKYTEWLKWSIYQNLIENTITRYISKIKKSNLDIIIVWSVSDKSKINPNLMKLELFEKQIPFEKYWKEECKKLLQKIISKKWLKLWDDVNIDDILPEIPDTEWWRNPEYIKRLIDIAQDYHLLNSENFESDMIISQTDIKEATKLMKEYSRSTADHVWF